MPENIIDVRINNTLSIINTIRFTDSYTKKDISQKLGLSFATVSNTCNELKERNVLIEREVSGSNAGRSNVGRSPKNILLNYSHFLAGCFDFHIQNTVTLALYDLRDEQVAEKTFIYDTGTEAEELISLCHKMFLEVLDDHQLTDKNIYGVGVAVPAVYQSETGLTIASGFEVFDNQPVKKYFEDIFHIPAFVDNESNLGALATMVFQSAGHNENLIYLFVSEGLGLGVINKGKVLTGAHGAAGEICHIPIGSEDFVCKLCGQRGCVESDLSIRGFLTSFYGETDSRANIAELWVKFVKKVHKGDGRAIAVVRDKAALMGRLISVLVNLLDPNAICIGGEIKSLFDLIYPDLVSEMNKRLLIKDARNITIFPDKYTDTILKGCSERAYTEFFPLLVK